MTYILLDESGDLGFSFDKGSSKYFVMAVLVTDNKRALEKIVRIVHKGIPAKKKLGVLHAYHDKPITRIRFLKRLANSGCKTFMLVVDKRKLADKTKKDPELYEYLAETLLARLFMSRSQELSKTVILIASRREKGKSSDSRFKERVESKIKSCCSVDIDIKICTPAQEKALQAVDVVSWAIFRKYEEGDNEYFNLIKNLDYGEPVAYPYTTKPYPLFRAAIR
jgi:hypothetical protein